MGSSNKGLFARRGRLWLAILATLLLLVIIAAFTLPGPTVQLQDVATRIEQPLSRLLGFEVSVRGPVLVRLSLRPSLILEEVHVRDARADSREEALVARDVRLRLNAWALLREHWSIVRLHVAGASLCVSWQTGSACDWRRALAAIDEVTNVDSFAVHGLKVRCTGGPCGETLERQIALIRGSLPAHGDVHVAVYERDAQDPPFVQLSGASWSELRANRPWRVRGSMRSGGTQADFSGRIEQPRDLRGVSGEFEARSDLGRWHEVELGEVRAHGRLAEEERGYRVLIDEGKWGTGTVRAEVHARGADAGFIVDGSLAAHHVDLDPWIDAPTQGEGAGGYADVDARFTTSGDSVAEWRRHMRGSAVVAAGPAELPIEQVERWSKGFLKFVFALPEEGAATHINCIGGDFDLRGDEAVTQNMRVDTTITQMRAVGSLSLSSGRIDFLVKPHLKKGPLKGAPLVAVSGRIERPVTRLASHDESSRSEPQFARLPVEPRDANRPCGQGSATAARSNAGEATEPK